jgi:hypothetical protein
MGPFMKTDQGILAVSSRLSLEMMENLGGPACQGPIGRAGNSFRDVRDAPVLD